jgi:hypothetical protein
MKPKLLLMLAAAAMVFAGYSKDLYNEGSGETTPAPPTFAASNKIWTFGDQVWSDAIRIPECNKTSFEDSYTDPQCRSYTEQGGTWYYYNWPYVNAHAARLCPSPWRVPTKVDLNTLVEATTYVVIIDAWGCGGLIDRAGDPTSRNTGYYWSSDIVREKVYACNLEFSPGSYSTDGSEFASGMQVRCVK